MARCCRLPLERFEFDHTITVEPAIPADLLGDITSTVAVGTAGASRGGRVVKTCSSQVRGRGIRQQKPRDVGDDGSDEWREAHG